MDNLANLILAGLALEAVTHLLRSIWNAEIRATYNIQRIVVLVVTVALVAVFSNGWNVVAGTGLDFGNAIVGSILTGLALVRAAYLIHQLTK